MGKSNILTKGIDYIVKVLKQDDKRIEIGFRRQKRPRGPVQIWKASYRGVGSKLDDFDGGQDNYDKKSISSSIMYIYYKIIDFLRSEEQPVTTIVLPSNN